MTPTELAFLLVGPVLFVLASLRLLAWAWEGSEP